MAAWWYCSRYSSRSQAATGPGIAGFSSAIRARYGQTVAVTSITRVSTSDASAEQLRQIRDLFFTAFDERFTEADWQHCLGGRHVIVAELGVIVAHAAVVSRVIEVGGEPFRTGYVEGVATHPARQREGLGTRTMDEAASLIRSEFEMGALATGVHGFYERLGWERWRGPTYVRYGSHLVRTEEEDGGIMALLFGPSARVDVTASITCECRAGDDW